MLLKNRYRTKKQPPSVTQILPEMNSSLCNVIKVKRGKERGSPPLGHPVCIVLLFLNLIRIIV